MFGAMLLGFVILLGVLFYQQDNHAVCIENLQDRIERLEEILGE